VSDIPGGTEAVQAAAKELYFAERFNAWDDESEKIRGGYERTARRALAAAVPFLERALRDKIADEIEDLGVIFSRDQRVMDLQNEALVDAARVARGGEATE
jgi:hypothetical protein